MIGKATEGECARWVFFLSCVSDNEPRRFAVRNGKYDHRLHSPLQPSTLHTPSPSTQKNPAKMRHGVTLKFSLQNDDDVCGHLLKFVPVQRSHHFKQTGWAYIPEMIDIVTVSLHFVLCILVCDCFQMRTARGSHLPGDDRLGGRGGLLVLK